MSTQIPKGWTDFGRLLSQKIGFLRIGPDYKKDWSETAKRYLRKWQKECEGSLYVIEEVSYDAFAQPYLKSTIPITLRGPTLWAIRMRIKSKQTPVTFTVARRIHDGRIVAGMACMKSSLLPISYYMAGFITKEAGNDPVMTGLFDYWFQWCMKTNVRFADFGGFWWKGGDSSWKGLSLFKGKFGPLYFFYPSVLFKFRLNGK